MKTPAVLSALSNNLWMVGSFVVWLVRFATGLIRRFFSCLLRRGGRVFSPTTLTNDNAPLHNRMQLAVVSYRP